MACGKRISWVLVAICASGCPDVGIIDDNPPDAGPDDPGITAADIGGPCVYDPATGANPTGECPLGLECLIVTRDGLYNTLGLDKDAWEDHFSVYRADGKDEGICTLVGSLNAPPVCPAGTVLKLFSSSAVGFAAACLRACEAPADCPRPGDTCDVRFIDDADDQVPGNQALCVRRCSLDLPECVRSGVFIADENGTLTSALFVDDAFGASKCNGNIGTCAAVPMRGGAGPGQPCTSTDQCADNTVCYQAPLLGGGSAELGFCGSPCNPTHAEACTTGLVCQPGLTLGFDPPVLIDLVNQRFLVAGGLCFPQCDLTASRCEAQFPGTSCGSANEAVFGAPWNQVSMCLPDLVRN